MTKISDEKAKKLGQIAAKQRDFLLKAFIEEVGCKPSQAEQVIKESEDGSEIKCFIRKKKGINNIITGKGNS